MSTPSRHALLHSGIPHLASGVAQDSSAVRGSPPNHTQDVISVSLHNVISSCLGKAYWL